MPGENSQSEESSKRKHGEPIAATRSSIRRAIGIFLLILAGLFFATVVFRPVNPLSPVMVAEIFGRPTLKQSWVPLEKISPDLPLAVVIKEDGRFCYHWGVDWLAVRDAIKESRRLGRDFRGASTITMQLTKNLYLWSERSYVRKMLEVPLAYILSALWPKRVLMETYLNIASMGPGTVGADAASRRFFRKSAAGLTRREAILLAAALPCPSTCNPAEPTPQMLKDLEKIERGMQMFPSRAECVLSQARISEPAVSEPVN